MGCLECVLPRRLLVGRDDDRHGSVKADFGVQERAVWELARQRVPCLTTTRRSSRFGNLKFLHSLWSCGNAGQEVLHGVRFFLHV